MKFRTNNKRKAGVSLVTVLMFMLVATIAATATYKWITSEGHSSASRMMQREAYQSAMAGIQNTRAWMTFHANDVGALIRQYIYDLNNCNNNNCQPKAVKTPINLDNQIRSFVNGGSQDHHVWLTGVNIDGDTYKVKILSEGISRDGQARHTEAAILNVSGLYQVNRPVVNIQAQSDLEFDYAYFGGSIVGTSSNYESAIINGDWNANPPTAQKNWVVTGNAELTGSSINLGGLTCIGGNLAAENTGISGKDLFVGGDAGVPKQSSFDLSGSAYFSGDVILGATGIARDGSYNMIIDSNVTLKGYMTSYDKGKYAKIKGNLCVGEEGAVVLHFADKDKSFVVEGNVWMPGKQNLAYGSVDKATARTGCTCDIIYPAYSTTVVQTGVTCDGEDHTYWGGCPYGYDNCKVKSKGCATETITRTKNFEENTDLAGQRSYGQIVMGKSGSEVYIKSARPSSDYASLSSKTITETGKKRCPSNKRFRIYGDNSDNWERPSGSGHFTKRNPTEGPLVCGELLKNDGEYVTYTYGTEGLREWTDYKKGWDDWTTATVSGFFESGRQANNDKYYIFDNTQTQTGFMAFEQKTYSTNDWRKYDVTPISGWNGDKGGGWFPIPMWSNDNNKFDNYFKSAVVAGLYKVGGQYFYDATNDAFNLYNYEEGRITGSPACKSNNSEPSRPYCLVNPWFKSEGTVHGKNGWPAKPSFDCADAVAEKCKKIWGNKLNTKKCGADYFVDDPIQIPLDELEAFATNKNACPSANGWNITLAESLNTCYRTIYNNENDRKNKLYNGEYLVVKIPGSQTNISGTLVGKFVIIVEDKIQAQNSIITASDNGILGGPNPGSFVLLYLKRGATSLPENSTAVKHLFIFMDEGFDGKSHLNLTGTLYFPANKCIKSEFQGASFVSDSLLLADLSINGIVCDKDKPCGAAALGGAPVAGGNAEAVLNMGGRDPYFISMAPQLGVTLESQYESSEEIPVVNAAGGGAALGQSFIVLPRIIYLTQDPYGKLSDYYNVIPLNGASVSKATANVNCIPELHVNSNLVEGDERLAEGLYNCTANPDGLASVPFYVWVKGLQAGAPPVNFQEGSANLTAGVPHEVKINLPPHSNTINIKVSAASVPAGWNLEVKDNISPEGDTYTFSFAADESGHATPTLFTLTPPPGATNGSVTFTLQAGEGYQLANPWTSTLLMASTVTLTNNKNKVSIADISKWCENHSDKCPENTSLSSWPDCPIVNSSEKEWVRPSWGLGFSTVNKNALWKIVAGGTDSDRLTLEEGDDADECVVIIPEENNSRSGPIQTDETLRATAKAKLHKIRIKFAGNIVGNPTVTVVTGGNTTYCDYKNKEVACPVPVFDGDSVFISIDRELYKDFNYWTCDNNGGATCPTTDPISSSKFSASEEHNGFTVKDNEAIVYAHFGEKDNHCFFDEFRKTSQDNNRHACYKPGETETEYCIGSGTNAKWKFESGHSSDTSFVERDPYQGYIVASTSAPKEGVKIMSTVQAGIHGTLKALFQPPHATSSYGKDSPRIKNSGFLLRADDDASGFWMLNVYENTSGNLAAQACLYPGDNCSAEIELAKENSSKASVTSSSMVMLSATLKGSDTLRLKAITDNFYNNSSFQESDYYKAEFILSSIGNNHAIMNYQYVGFSLASREFKIYGIGWQSDDYGSECFDGPPSIKCSFAAVAVDGVVPTYGTGLGQSNEYQRPWVGHSGWFDSKDCSVSYSYVAGSATNDATVDSENGYYFDESGVGAHGYRDNNRDVKTAYATLANCKYAETDVLAWQSTVDPAHCGPFWTGKFSECQADASLLSNERLIASGEEYKPTFTAMDLRGIKDFVIEVKNDYDDVDLEVWLESNSDSWGGVNYQSRHVRIFGSTETITKHFSIAASGTTYEDLADNAAGFDPENVVLIAFKNNGANPVTVKSAEAQCKNTVRFDGCTAVRAGETEWKVTLNVSENSDKLSKIRLKADVDGASYLSDIEHDYAGLEYGVADPEAFSNAGKTYTFWAQVYSQVNNYTSDWVECSCNGDCSVGAITCGEASIAHTKLNSSNEIEYGEGSPEYSFKLSGCPDKGCAYEIYLDGTKVSECTNAEAASTGCSKNPHFAGEQMEVRDTPYKYEVRNPAGSKTEIKSLAACDKTFKVVEHVKDPVTCRITSGTTNASAADLGGSAEIPSNKISVSCPEGTCTYTVKENGSTVGSGTYSDTYGFSISDGATEAGSHTYTATVTRGSEALVACDGSYTINYPLNLDCDSWTDPGASTPVAAGTSITPVKTKAGSGNTNTGCGENCTYDIKKGSTSVYGGAKTGYDGSSATDSFTDADGSGEVTYTLTVNHGTLSKDCRFKVTYGTASTPPSGCTVVTQSIGASDNNVHINDSLNSGCADITLNKVCLGQLNVDVADCKGKAGAWNGTSFSLSNDNGTYYAQYNPSPNLTYHLEVSDCSDKAFHVYMSECNALPAASNVPEINGCPTTTMTKSPNASINTSITIDNCEVVGGCTYTITKNSVSGPAISYYSGTLPPISGEASGTYTYVISARNSKGSVPTSGLCSFDVVYSSDAPTTIENYQPNYTLNPGKYTLEKCNGMTGTKTTQITASFANCWDAFSATTGAGYWNNVTGNCNGYASVTYPVTVTVPSGGTLTLSNCY